MIAMPLFRSLAGPATACVAIGILLEGGADYTSVVIAFLVVMTTISLLVRE